MDFWRGEAYMAFFDYLDRTGGFYYEVRTYRSNVSPRLLQADNWYHQALGRCTGPLDRGSPFRWKVTDPLFPRDWVWAQSVHALSYRRGTLEKRAVYMRSHAQLRYVFFWISYLCAQSPFLTYVLVTFRLWWLFVYEEVGSARGQLTIPNTPTFPRFSPANRKCLDFIASHSTNLTCSFIIKWHIVILYHCHGYIYWTSSIYNFFFIITPQRFPSIIGELQNTDNHIKDLTSSLCISTESSIVLSCYCFFFLSFALCLIFYLTILCPVYKVHLIVCYFLDVLNPFSRFRTRKRMCITSHGSLLVPISVLRCPSRTAVTSSHGLTIIFYNVHDTSLKWWSCDRMHRFISQRVVNGVNTITRGILLRF
jgi:Glycolipid 2-alpha-mannosyltransferase